MFNHSFYHTFGLTAHFYISFPFKRWVLILSVPQFRLWDYEGQSSSSLIPGRIDLHILSFIILDPTFLLQDQGLKDRDKDGSIGDPEMISYHLVAYHPRSPWNCRRPWLGDSISWYKDLIHNKIKSQEMKGHYNFYPRICNRPTVSEWPVNPGIIGGTQ